MTGPPPDPRQPAPRRALVRGSASRVARDRCPRPTPRQRAAPPGTAAAAPARRPGSPGRAPPADAAPAGVAAPCDSPRRIPSGSRPRTPPAKTSTGTPRTASERRCAASCPSALRPDQHPRKHSHLDRLDHDPGAVTRRPTPAAGSPERHHVDHGEAGAEASWTAPTASGLGGRRTKPSKRCGKG